MHTLALTAYTIGITLVFTAALFAEAWLAALIVGTGLTLGPAALLYHLEEK